MQNPALEKAVVFARSMDMPNRATQDPSVLGEHLYARFGQTIFVAADLLILGDNEEVVQVTLYDCPGDLNDPCAMSTKDGKTHQDELVLENATEPFFLTRAAFGALVSFILADHEV